MDKTERLAIIGGRSIGRDAVAMVINNLPNKDIILIDETNSKTMETRPKQPEVVSQDDTIIRRDAHDFLNGFTYLRGLGTEHGAIFTPKSHNVANYASHRRTKAKNKIKALLKTRRRNKRR